MSLLDPMDEICENALRAQKYYTILEYAKNRIRQGAFPHCNLTEREQLIRTRGCYEGLIVWDIWPNTIRKVYYVLVINEHFVPEWVLVE